MPEQTIRKIFTIIAIPLVIGCGLGLWLHPTLKYTTIWQSHELWYGLGVVVGLTLGVIGGILHVLPFVEKRWGDDPSRYD